MTYIPGGKGIAPRQNIKPSWLKLKEIKRDEKFVYFKTMGGTKTVSLNDVNEYEKRKRIK